MKENHKILSVVFRDGLEQSLNSINCITSTPTSLLTGSRDGVIREYNTLDRSLSNIYYGHAHWVNALEPMHSLFFSASSDSRIIAWRWEDPKPVQVLNFHKDYVHCIKAHDNFLYSAGEDGLLVKTDLEYKPSHLYSFNSSVWHLDYQENIVAVALGCKNFKIVDFRAVKPEIEIKGHSGIVRRVLLSPDQGEILTCSSDGLVKLWDLGTKKLKENFRIHNTSVFALKCDWTRRCFISGDKDGFVYKVNLDSHETEQVCKEEFAVLDVEEVQDEVWVATTNSSVRSYKSLQEQRSIIGKPRILQCGLTDNKKFVVTKDSRQEVKVVNVLENRIEAENIGFEEAVSKFSSGKTANSWFSLNLKLGCVTLEFAAGDCLSGYEIRDNQQVFFMEILLKELFSALCYVEDTERTNNFGRIWLILKQHLAEKTEVYWMSQAKDLYTNRVSEVPIWIRDIIPEVNKGINSYN